MLIKSVLSGLSRAASFGRGKAALEATGRQAIEAPPAGSAVATESGSQLRDILAQYDVTDISPQSFSDLLERLRQAGLLADKDYQELATIRLDLDCDGIAPQERVNLLEIYVKKLRTAEQDAKEAEGKRGAAAARATSAALRRHVDWLQKLAAIHASPEAATINALA
jgi:hypothetical protein